VYVKRFVGVFSDGLQNRKPERNVGDKNTVHDVDM